MPQLPTPAARSRALPVARLRTVTFLVLTRNTVVVSENVAGHSIARARNRLDLERAGSDIRRDLAHVLRSPVRLSFADEDAAPTLVEQIISGNDAAAASSSIRNTFITMGSRWALPAGPSMRRRAWAYMKRPSVEIRSTCQVRTFSTRSYPPPHDRRQKMVSRDRQLIIAHRPSHFYARKLRFVRSGGTAIRGIGSAADFAAMLGLESCGGGGGGGAGHFIADAGPSPTPTPTPRRTVTIFPSRRHNLAHGNSMPLKEQPRSSSAAGRPAFASATMRPPNDIEVQLPSSGTWDALPSNGGTCSSSSRSSPTSLFSRRWAGYKYSAYA